MSSFKMQIHSRDRNRDCEVSTLSRFLLRVNPSLDPKELLSNDEHQYYQAVKESIELCRKRAKEAYDYVVIDKGQDMFDKGVDLIINEFAGSSHDGLNNGRRLLLYDIDQSYRTDGRNVLDISYLLSGYFAHYELNDVKRSSQNPDIRSLSRDIIDDVGILRKDHYDA